jgi:hypothetical protein
MWDPTRIHKAPTLIRNSIQQHMVRTLRTLPITTTRDRMRKILIRELIKRNHIITSKGVGMEEMEHKNIIEMETKQRIRGLTRLRISNRRTQPIRSRAGLLIKSMRRG